MGARLVGSCYSKRNSPSAQGIGVNTSVTKKCVHVMCSEVSVPPPLPPQILLKCISRTEEFQLSVFVQFMQFPDFELVSVLIRVCKSNCIPALGSCDPASCSGTPPALKSRCTQSWYTTTTLDSTPMQCLSLWTPP